MKMQILLLAIALTCANINSAKGASFHPVAPAPLPAVADRTGEIKEYHFHVYFFQRSKAQTRQALKLRDMIIDNVKAKNFTAVCAGITKDILPGLNEEHVRKFNTEPVGPHPIGSYEVWTPKEYLAHLTSFFLLNRGDLSILLHPIGGPIGRSSYEDHDEDHVMWLGPSFRMDLDFLSKTAREPSQYPELRLGYNAP